jgi:flagellar protein FliL
MAKENKNAGGEIGKAAEAAALKASVPNVPGGNVEGKKGKSIVKIAIIGLAILVLLAGVGGIVWWLRGSASASVPPVQGEGAAAEGAAGGSPDSEANPKADADTSKTTPKVMGLLTLEPFTVNLADKETTRYMRLNVKLGLDSAKAVEGIQKDEIVNARVRDAILGLVASLTMDQVLSTEGKANLRKEITSKVNDILSEGKVIEVYFLELVVQ